MAIKNDSTFAEVLNVFIALFDNIITLLVVLIFFFVLWRVFTTWFLHGDDPKEIERGRQSVFIGLLVLVLVIGLWGVVAIVRTTFFGS
jgi:hypothetical protein